MHHRQATYARSLGRVGLILVSMTSAVAALTSGPSLARAEGLETILVERKDGPLASAAQALAKGDHKTTLAVLKDYVGPARAFADHLRAHALWATGEREAADQTWDRLTFETCRAAGRSPLEDRVRLVRAALTAPLDPEGAADQLLALAADPQRWLAAVDLLNRAKNEERVEALVRRMLIQFPAAPQTAEVARGLGPDGVKARLVDPADRLKRLRNLVSANANVDAAKEAAELLEDLPAGHADRCEALYLQGRTARKRRRYTEALEILPTAKKACAKHERAMRSALLEAQVLAIRKDVDALKRIVDWMTRRFPGHRFIDDAEFLLADALDRRGLTRMANDAYTRVTKMKGADYATLAHWRVAWSSIQANKTQRARPRLQGIIDGKTSRREDRERAEYWLARLDEPKKPSAAKKRYAQLAARPSFYGWLALERLRSFHPPTAKVAEDRLRQAATATATFALPKHLLTAPAFAQARAYAEIGENELAAWSLRRLNCDYTDPNTIIAVAVLLEAIGAYKDAQLQIRRRSSVLSDPLSANTVARWRAAYSRPFRSELGWASKEAKIDELLLTAVVRQESVFDPQIVSWAGATGLAQLMPATAKAAYKQIYNTDLDLQRLTDPALNARLGAHVLAQEIGRLQSPVLAFGAYNGGRRLVHQYLDEKPQPFERWIEEFGVKETRRYMKRVTESWGIYRLLYDKKAPFIRLPVTVARRR